ncbi:MAG: hypothetical protein EON93_26315 [Burkholderiales bacterium]|nr:MAG: hypothetical protein EON93_26315 [Burkholderiales bacterium]
MTADIDGGDILLRQPIDILEDDVAFSLGAKCIEAGRETFTTLVGMLADEAAGKALVVRKQGAGEGFHLRSDRPGLGIIDFGKTGREIRNLVRAMNLGSDDNWMCRPKLALPSGLVVAEHAEAVVRPQSVSGTVLAVDAKGIEIAVADGALRFELLSTLEGAHVDPLAIGLRAGDVVAASEGAEAAAEIDARLTKHERFWVGRLATMRAPTVAGVKAHAGVAEPAIEFRKDDLFDLALVKSLPAGLQDAFAERVPFRVSVNKADGFEALRAQVTQEFATQDKRVSHARDVVTRYQALRSTVRATLNVGLQFAALARLSAEAALAGGQLLSLVIPDEGETFAWAYDARAIDPASLKMLADRFDILLAQGLQHANISVSRLDFLPAAERTLLLEAWQDTAVTGVPTLGIHQMFEAQAARTPDAIALRFKNASLTYRQLDERANAVADALRASGVSPGALVAVGMERSLELVVGLFGVLKAGGAYVPLESYENV